MGEISRWCFEKITFLTQIVVTYHFQTFPLHIKRDFFHLKSWVVSCIERREFEKKRWRRNNIITRRKYNRCDDIFSHAFEKRVSDSEKKKKKIFQRLRKNIIFCAFFLFVLRKNDYERKFFSSQKHTPRTREFLWDSFNTGVVFFCLSCSSPRAVVYWWVHFSFFSFILWFI